MTPSLTHTKWSGLWFVLVVLLSGLLVGAVLLPTGGRTARADPGIIYVDADAAGTSHDGLSWATAFTNLQDALDAAGNGDEIWVASGVYTPGVARTDTFTLSAGVAMYGGFPPGGGDGTFQARDWETYVTVLSGDIGGDDGTDASGVVTDTANIVGDNAYHVVTGDGVAETAGLDGFTISAGSADGDWPQSCGGGMYNYDNSSLKLTNVTFRGNEAESHGGGIFNYGTLTVDRCTFASNQTGGMGAGVASFNGVMTVNSTALYDNEATLNGGGVCSSDGILVVNNSTFSGNRASEGLLDNYGGGGIYCLAYYQAAETTINNSTIASNSAKFGGGICNNGGRMSLKNTIVAHNMVHAGGEGPNCSSSDTITTSYNLESGTDCEFIGTGDLQDVDARIGFLQDNGGPTWTHALWADSPAINAGSCTDIFGNPVTTDQRGVRRIGPCDIGAYEYVLRAYLPLVLRNG